MKINFGHLSLLLFNFLVFFIFEVRDCGDCPGDGDHHMASDHLRDIDHPRVDGHPKGGKQSRPGS